MYAITSTGYRSVADGMQLAPGEQLVDSLPESMAGLLDAQQGRVRRDALLRDTDWTQAPDSPLSAAVRAQYLEYRANLRALPTLPGFPDCDWPVEPSTGGDATIANGQTETLEVTG